MSKDPIGKLYGVVKADGRYTGGYDEFVEKMRSETYRDKVFDSVSQAGEYSYNKDSFHVKYRPHSLEFMDDGSVFNNNKKYKEEDIVPTAGGDMERGLGNDPNEFNYTKKLRPVDASLMDMDDKNVVKELKERYSGMGFEFDDTGLVLGIGDYIRVTHPDAPEGIKISTDNFTKKGNQKAADELNQFFSKHSNPTEEQIKNSHALPHELSRINNMIDEPLPQEGSVTDLKTDGRLSKEAYLKKANEDIEGGWFSRFGEKLSKGVDLGPSYLGQGGTQALKIVGDIINENTNKHLDNAEDYYDELQKYPEQFKEQVGELSKEDYIKSKAIDLRSEELAENDKIERINDHLSNTSSEREDYLMKRSAKEVELVTSRVKDNKIKLNRVQILQDAVLQEHDDLVNELDILNKRVDGGEKLTREEIETFKIREEKFRNTYNLVNKAKMKHAYLNLDKEIQTETLDYLDNINHATGNMLYTLSLGTVKLGGQALWLGGNVTNGIGNALQNSVDNDGTYEDDVLKSQVSGVKTITQGLRDGADYFYELSEKGEKYKKKQPVGFSGFQSTIEKGLLGVFENLPNLALAYATGGGSMTANMAVFGLSGGADKHREMVKDVEAGNASYTTDQLIMAPIGYGAFEAVTMLPEYYMMRGAFKSGSSGPFGKTMDKLLGQSFMSKVGRSVLGFGKAQASEISQEIFTQIGQNATDKFLLGKEDVELADGIDADFFIKTFGSTGAFHVGPRALQGAMSLISGQLLESDNVAMNKAAAKLVNIEQRIELVKKELLGADDDAVNNSVGKRKEDLQEQLKGLELEKKKATKEAEENINNINERYNTLNRRGVNILRGLARKSGKLRTEARKIKNGEGKYSELSRKQKKAKLQGLENEFKAIEEQKEKLINNDKSYQLEDGRVVKDLEKRARAVLDAKSKTNPNLEQVQKQAQKMWNEENKTKDTAVKRAKAVVKDNIKRIESDILIEQLNTIDPDLPIEKLEAKTLKEAKDWLRNNLKEKGLSTREINKSVKDLEDNWETATAGIIQPRVKGKTVNSKTNLFDKHQF